MALSQSPLDVSSDNSSTFYTDIPPAFYQTGDPPPPPPDDPHYTEWPRDDSGPDDSRQGDAIAESRYEPSPRWLVPIVVGGLGFILMLHAALAVVLVIGSTN